MSNNVEIDLTGEYMITRNRRKPISFDRSRIPKRTHYRRQSLGDKRISYYMPLWAFITAVVLTLTLSLHHSATTYAQESTADAQGDQKSRTFRKGKVRRARSKMKTRPGAGRNARSNSEAESRESENEQSGAVSPTSDRASGRNRLAAKKGESDRSESADSGNKRGERATTSENDTHSADEFGTGDPGATTIDSALKGGATQRSNRMEFDARLVYGETAGSGAVILFERGQRHLPPLTKQRTQFLSATTEPIFGKKNGSRYRVRYDSKEVKSDNTENKSTNDGLRN